MPIKLPPYLQSLISRPLLLIIGTGQSLAAGHVFVEYGYSTGSALGPSMLPTFEVIGEQLLISRRHRYGRNLLVGDLVVYKIPTYPETEGVKRVLGLPGDYVLMNSPDSESDTMIQVRTPSSVPAIRCPN